MKSNTDFMGTITILYKSSQFLLNKLFQNYFYLNIMIMPVTITFGRSLTQAITTNPTEREKQREIYLKQDYESVTVQAISITH